MCIATEAPGVVIGLDLTNIYVGRVHAARRHGEDPFEVRLIGRQLYRLAAAGRPVFKAYALVNERVPAEVRAHFTPYFTIVPVDVHPVTGREIAGDEKLQNRLVAAMDNAPAPSTLVLMTGDGSGVAHHTGFGSLLVPARRRGWGVEVLAWKDSTNRRLAELAREVGTLVALDDWYYAITYVERGKRFAQAVLARYRPTRPPRAWSTSESAAVQRIAESWKEENDGRPRAA